MDFEYTCIKHHLPGSSSKENCDLSQFNLITRKQILSTLATPFDYLFAGITGLISRLSPPN